MATEALIDQLCREISDCVVGAERQKLEAYVELGLTPAQLRDFVRHFVAAYPEASWSTLWDALPDELRPPRS